MKHNHLLKILDEARALNDELVGIRRELHRIPEPGFEEKKTAQFITATLRRWNLPFREGIAGTGVVASIGVDSGIPTVALRADIDALPIEEENDIPYRSQHPGYMHACGHDLHTTILLGALNLLKKRRDDLSVNVRAIFQPAEERFPGGAQNMIKEGVLDDPLVAAIFGLHVDPFIETGMIALKEGPMMASAAKFDITVSGKGGHSAKPHDSVDPIPVAAGIVTGLQSLSGGKIDPFIPAIITVTQIRAGNTYNIIPETAVLKGTARSLDPGIAGMLPKLMERVIAGVAAAHGARYEFRYTPATAALANDAAMTDHVRKVCTEMLGEKAVGDYPGTLGGEDFAGYLQRVPGCFFRLGARKPDKEPMPQHHPRFDPDEHALVYGAALMAGIILRYPA